MKYVLLAFIMGCTLGKTLKKEAKTTLKTGEDILVGITEESFAEMRKSMTQTKSGKFKNLAECRQNKKCLDEVKKYLQR